MRIRPSLRRRRAPARRRASRRALSDVVATFIILALTVVLASVIFTAVSSYPVNTPVPSNEFALNFSTGTNATSGNAVITYLGITLVQGSPVVGANVYSASIQLSSAEVPKAFPNAYTLSQGLSGSSNWRPGQTWVLNVQPWAIPFGKWGSGHLWDNLTVEVFQGGVLIFWGITPGFQPDYVPSFNGCSVSPSAPAVGTAFNVTCSIQSLNGFWSTSPVTLNLSALPGQSATAAVMKYSAASGLWYYVVAGGGSKAGTWPIFVTAIASDDESNSFVLYVSV